MKKKRVPKKFFNFKKRMGLSAIVTTLIIILLSIVVIGILWVVVKGVIQTNAEKINLGQYTLNVDIKSAQVEGDNSSVSVTVKRNAGMGNFFAMIFVFSDGHNSETILENSSLNELEEKTFFFTLTKISPEDITKISVAPVFVLSSGKEVNGNVVDTYDVSEKGLGVGTGTGEAVIELTNFQKYGPVGAGATDYKVSSGASDIQIKDILIDPLDVHVGDNQTFTVTVYSPYNVTSVNSVTQLDNEVLNLPLEKIYESPEETVFAASWIVYDTHSETYRTSFTATDSQGNVAVSNLTWTDPCSGITQGANSILSAPCTVSGVDGLDTGNITIAQGVTLTLNSGATFVWTSGYSINVTGSIALASGSALQKGYLYYYDGDSDTYGNGTFDWSSSATYSGHVRAKDVAGTDCSDSNGYIFQTVSSLRSDNDQDGYTDTGSASRCVGGSTVVSGRTYYRDSSGSYSWLNSAQVLGTTDCNDANAGVVTYYTIGEDCNVNSCGTVGGTVTDACTGSCSGSTPATPYTFGADCNVNACGTAGGTITNECTGTCSGSTPAVPTWYVDMDSDGYYPSTSQQCSSPGGGSATSGKTAGDCDDSSGSIYLGVQRTRYGGASASCGTYCNSETQTCQSNNAWSGSYSATSCSGIASTRTGYTTSSVSCGNTCTTQAQTCTSGGWDGTGIGSCTVDSCCTPNGSIPPDVVGDTCQYNSFCCSGLAELGECVPEGSCNPQ